MRITPDLPYGEAEKFVEPGLTTQVKWRMEGGALVREERITAAHPVRLRKMSVIFPSSGDHAVHGCEGERISYQFTGADAKLTVSITSSGIRFADSLQATGNSALGKGTRGPIPLILRLEASVLMVDPDKPVGWMIRLQLQ